MSDDRPLLGVDALIDLTDSVLMRNGFALAECPHGVSLNRECELCEETHED